jgi:hypothetical protein
LRLENAHKTAIFVEKMMNFDEKLEIFIETLIFLSIFGEKSKWRTIMIFDIKKSKIVGKTLGETIRKTFNPKYPGSRLKIQSLSRIYQSRKIPIPYDSSKHSLART